LLRRQHAGELSETINTYKTILESEQQRIERLEAAYAADCLRLNDEKKVLAERVKELEYQLTMTSDDRYRRLQQMHEDHLEIVENTLEKCRQENLQLKEALNKKSSVQDELDALMPVTPLFPAAPVSFTAGPSRELAALKQDQARALDLMNQQREMIEEQRDFLRSLQRLQMQAPAHSSPPPLLVELHEAPAAPGPPPPPPPLGAPPPPPLAALPPAQPPKKRAAAKGGAGISAALKRRESMKLVQHKDQIIPLLTAIAETEFETSEAAITATSRWDDELSELGLSATGEEWQVKLDIKAKDGGQHFDTTALQLAAKAFQRFNTMYLLC
jgi:hypothetical protein